MSATPAGGAVAQIDLRASVDRARSRGLLARVQFQTKNSFLVVERGLEARGYALHFCIRRLSNTPVS
jgi:hypothetical protein